MVSASAAILAAGGRGCVEIGGVAGGQVFSDDLTLSRFCGRHGEEQKAVEP